MRLVCASRTEAGARRLAAARLAAGTSGAAMEARLAALEAKIAVLEAKLSALSPDAPPPGPPRPSLRRIRDRVLRASGISAADFHGRRKTVPIARSRQMFSYWAVRLTLCSLPDIGRFCNRDHTTVLHNCRRWPQIRAEAGRHLRPVLRGAPAAPSKGSR